jgi:sulfur relay (sulfurtransferase) complex TusBCD TusD component (DsrE family)
MKWFITISSNDPETAYNAMRLANVALIKKQQEVGVFMLGKAVEFPEFSTEEFNVAGLTEEFMEAGGDFFV